MKSQNWGNSLVVMLVWFVPQVSIDTHRDLPSTFSDGRGSRFRGHVKGAVKEIHTILSSFHAAAILATISEWLNYLV